MMYNARMRKAAADLKSVDLDKIGKRDLATWLVDGIVGADGRMISNAGPLYLVMRWSKRDIINDIRDILERLS